MSFPSVLSSTAIPRGILAGMATTWIRAVQNDQNNGGFFGSEQQIGLNPQQTVLRAYWNIQLYQLWGDQNFYPPGSSLCRAGLLYAENGLDPLATPTPISNPDADWMDIETISPEVSYTTSTINNWLVRWSFRFDQSVKSQRRNDGPGLMGLYVAWEFLLGENRIDPFQILGWNSSIDALVTLPPE